MAMLARMATRSNPLHLQMEKLEMSHDQDWDLEKYNSPHEPKHHWQLKKKFMEHHKDRFPESELVSGFSVVDYQRF